MLISFTVANWRLFRGEVSFSMVASAEKQNKERVASLTTIGIKALPVAAIYGGNASGKSSLLKALMFMQRFVVIGTQPDSLIQVEPFKLDAACLDAPSHFKIQILVDEKCYEYRFSLTRKRVVAESLRQVLKTTDKELYKRENGAIEFHSSLYASAKEKLFLEFIFKGTRENQLFLTNAVNQNFNFFKPLYQWFKATLHILAPDTEFGDFSRFIEDSNPLSSKMKEILPLLDMGIIKLLGKEVVLESMGLPPQVTERIKSSPKGRLRIEGDRYVSSYQSGELKLKKVMAIHQDAAGKEVEFDLKEESDGTRRCIDLLPLFIDLATPHSTKVYVVDELDNRLHTELLLSLLTYFLEKCSSSGRAQLVFTTHNLLTMDQELLRRDEIWVTERTKEGSAQLISFGEYKDIRNDKNIRKSYLQGRLGGLPAIRLNRVS